MKKITAVLSLFVLVITFSFLVFVNATTADNYLSHAAEDAKAYLIEPKDGAKVSSPFLVKFGLSGMKIVPAGVDQENTGHHHLLIDLDRLPNLNDPLPANEQIRHFGKGQTETSLELEPGEHTLQLVVGNYAHIPHDNPVISPKIKVTVNSQD